MRPSIGLCRCLYIPLKARPVASCTLRLSPRLLTTSCFQAVLDGLPPKPKLHLDDKYSPEAIEYGWYEYWHSRGLLDAGTTKGRGDLPGREEKPIIKMLLPPPNVTGELHIGHALMLSIQDSLARYYRMRGHPVVWRPGTDHAGIATQTAVERYLNITSRDSLGRESLLPEIERWRQDYGGKILRQMERLGSSADPALEYYTLSKDLSEAVGRAFVKLHQEGLIYRSTRMVNWSVQAGTALSEIELEINEVGPDSIIDGVNFGLLHEIAYKVVGGEKEREIIVSTTRPETIYGDRAIGVHPDDPRYEDLHYKLVQHPLLPDVQIPIVPDADLVDPEFGTGAVKITPAHDANDFEFWKRHSTFAPPNKDPMSLESSLYKRVPIPLVHVFGPDGKMLSSSTSPEVAGRDRLHVRSEVIHILRGTKKAYRGSHTHAMRVARCSRTGCVIEPMLCPQWFLQAQPLAEKVLLKGISTPSEGADKSVKGQDDALVVWPWGFDAEWKTWLGGVKDWCLSRQIWWGHRIPAWRVVDPNAPQKGQAAMVTDDPNERWIVALTEEEARAQLKLQEKHYQLVQDEDVLDTWFSSGLLPLTTAGWTGNDQSSEPWRENYPLTFIESGSDILFFWLARMAMLCTWFSGQLPFKEILLHPLVCDSIGRKMSKSVGNVLDPLAIVEGRTPEQAQAAVALESKLKLQRITEIKEKMEDEARTKRDSRKVQHLTKDIKKNVRAGLKLFPKGIPQSGADPLRMALIDYMRQTRRISFDVHTVDAFRKLWIKLFNIVKYYDGLRSSSASPSDIDIPEYIPASWRGKIQLHDLFMLYHLRQTIHKCNSAFESRKMHTAIEALRKFIWDALGRVYIMFLKPELEQGIPAREEMALRLTVFAIDVVCRLAHPIAPYMTEALWQNLDPVNRQNVDGASILSQPYPVEQDIFDIVDEELVPMDAVMELTELLRSTKELNPKTLEAEGTWLRVLVMGGGANDKAIKKYEAQIAKLAKMSRVLEVVEGAENAVLKRLDLPTVPNQTSLMRDEGANGWWLVFKSTGRKFGDLGKREGD